MRDWELKTRIISALVLIAITLSCLLISPVTRIIYFAVAGLLCAWISGNLFITAAVCCVVVLLTEFFL